MTTINGNAFHTAVLDGIREMAGKDQKQSFTYTDTFRKIEEAQKAGRQFLSRDEGSDLLAGVLTYWNELLRSGVLCFGGSEGAWRTDVFHLAETGRKTLENLGRDPINPDGYMLHLKTCTTLDPISESYIKEALHTYQAGCHKATAVMVGTAAEGMILNLRETVVQRLRAANKPVPSNLEGWRIKTVCDELEKVLEENQKHMPSELFDEYDTLWSGFTSHLRAIRSKSGHPNSIEPVSPDRVHAALLTFPEFAQLIAALEKWALAHAF